MVNQRTLFGEKLDTNKYKILTVYFCSTSTRKDVEMGLEKIALLSLLFIKTFIVYSMVKYSKGKNFRSYGKIVRENQGSK